MKRYEEVTNNLEKRFKELVEKTEALTPHQIGNVWVNPGDKKLLDRAVKEGLIPADFQIVDMSEVKKKLKAKSAKGP